MNATTIMRLRHRIHEQLESARTTLVPVVGSHYWLKVHHANRTVIFTSEADMVRYMEHWGWTPAK